MKQLLNRLPDFLYVAIRLGRLRNILILLLVVMVFGAVLVSLHYSQRRAMDSHALLENRILEARIELSDGFFLVMMEADSLTPFERDRGIALIRQAVRTLEDADRKLSRRSGLLPLAVEEMNQRLQHLRQEGGLSSEDTVLTRITFRKLQREAETLAMETQRVMSALSAQQDREFLSALSIGGLLLGVLAFMLFVSEYGREAEAQRRLSAEQALKDAHYRLRQITDSLPQVLWTCTPDGRCDFLSPQWEHYTGVPVEAQLSASWLSCVHEDDRNEVELAWNSALAAGTVFRHEHRLRMADGSSRWFDSRANPLRGQDGAIVKWCGSSTDIDDRKRLEEELRLWADAFQHCGHGVAIGNPKTGLVIACNQAFAHLLQKKPEAIVGSPSIDLYESSDRSRVESLRRQADETGQIRFESWMPLPGRGRLLAQMDIVSVRANDGRLLYRVVTAQDITERRRAETELKQSESRLRLFVEHAPAALAMFDLEMRFLITSRRWLQDYGMPGRDVHGLNLYEVFPEIGEPWKAAHRRGLSGEVITNDKDRFERADGSVQWLRWEVRPWRTVKNAIGGIVIFSEELTEREKTSEELKSSRDRFEAVIRNLNEGLIVTSVDGTLLHCNPAAVAMHGMTNDAEWNHDLAYFAKTFELRDHDGRLLGHEEWPIARLIRGEPVHLDEFWLSRTSGTWKRLISYSGSSFISGQSGRIVFLTMSDVTERFQAAAAHRLIDERFLMAMRGADDGVWDWNLVSGELYISPRWKNMLGYADGELVNEMSTFLHLLHPDDRDKAMQAIDAVRAMRSDRIYFEVRMRHKDGHYVHVLSRGGRMPNEDGKMLRLVGTHVDISGLKQAEEEIRQLNAGLNARVSERSARLAEANKDIESFSYSVSHYLRSPLRAIDGFARVLEDSHAEKLDEAGKAYLGRIVRATERMSRLIDDMLDYSRIGRSELAPRYTDLVPLAREAIARLARHEPERKYTLKLPSSLTIYGDSRLLGIMLDNLLHNAWKFSSKKDETKIELGLLLCAEGRSGGFIRDNGDGFDMAHVRKLFIPFQRLHHAQEFSGSGIGLATVERIVARHGGRIWAEAKPNEGAVFSFEFPNIPASQ
jgi:PAS domain S-box-containing protein